MGRGEKRAEKMYSGAVKERRRGQEEERCTR